LGGEAIWFGMKRDAELTVLDGCGNLRSKQDESFCDRNHDRVGLNAVGHSAGAVFHSHFIPKATLSGNPHFKTTSFMAPAVRVDTFIELLITPSALEVGKLAIFTMKKNWEQKGN
jgi:hypothetical protein